MPKTSVYRVVFLFNLFTSLCAHLSQPIRRCTTILTLDINMLLTPTSNLSFPVAHICLDGYKCYLSCQMFQNFFIPSASLACQLWLFFALSSPLFAAAFFVDSSCCSIKKFCSSLSSFRVICLQLNKICKFKAEPNKICTQRAHKGKRWLNKDATNQIQHSFVAAKKKNSDIVLHLLLRTVSFQWQQIEK